MGYQGYAVPGSEDTPPGEGLIRIQAPEGEAPLDTELLYKALVDKHRGRFEKWAEWRKPFERIWIQCYEMYLVASKPAQLLTRAKIILPIVFQVIEAAVPKLVSIIIGQNPFFQVVPRNSQTQVPTEVLEGIHDLIDAQLDLAGFYAKFVEFVKQLLIYGTSYFFVYQKVRREWVYDRTAKRGTVSFNGTILDENALQWEKTLTYKVVERRPEVDLLAIEDVFPDPDARNEDEGIGIYVVSSVSRDQFKELCSGKFPTFTNYEMWDQNKGDTPQLQMRQDKRSARGVTEPKAAVKDDTRVELLTFWGREDLDGDGIAEEVQLVIADRRTLVKAIRNPFEHQKRPVVRAVLFPVPLEWYGLGMVEPIIPLVHELNTVRNQNIDMNNLIINRMWKVDALADIDLDTLISSPNGIIVTSPMDGVEQLDQPTIPYSPIQMSEMIQQDIESATAPKSVQGSQESGALGRTARGAQLIISQALEKFGVGGRLIEENAVRRVLRLMHKLNQQYLDQDEIIQEFYPDSNLTPEQIYMDVDFKLRGVSETVTKEAMLNQIIAFKGSFADVQGINWINVAKAVWRLMQISTPVDEVIPPVDPFAAPPPMPGGAPGQAADPLQAQALQNGVDSGVSLPPVQGGMNGPGAAAQ